MQLLLKHGADRNVANSRRETPMDLAEVAADPAVLLLMQEGPTDGGPPPRACKVYLNSFQSAVRKK